jgi:hypothetical protein
MTLSCWLHLLGGFYWSWQLCLLGEGWERALPKVISSTFYSRREFGCMFTSLNHSKGTTRYCQAAMALPCVHPAHLAFCISLAIKPNDGLSGHMCTKYTTMPDVAQVPEYQSACSSLKMYKGIVGQLTDFSLTDCLANSYTSCPF